MSVVHRYLEKPHLVTSIILVAAFIGFVGYQRMPVNLFPDSERPQIAVVTVYPGASSKDVESEVSRTIEKELSTIELVRRVTSVSKDEVSAVTVEFEYAKGLDSAATDVSNGLDKIRARLPQTIRSPMLFKISSATPAVMTLALVPAENSPLDLSMVRQLADNEIKERLLQLGEVANVEVFGAHQPVVEVALDRHKLERYGLTPQVVRAQLSAYNANQPVGLLITADSQLLLKRTGQFESLTEVGRIPVAHRDGGDVHLVDVATVKRGILEPQSAYHGNGAPAIAVNIELSVGNMLDALRDAVIMTVLVIFLFLADLRGMTLAAISIPFTYLLTFAAMWLIGYEFNMVTLTAVIVAVGMLVDDAIVVLENIERHYHGEGTDLREAVLGGTTEVLLAVFSGTFTTVIVLLPIMFIGGYVETVLRPLTVTLSIALFSSYIVSVTIIPMLAPWILKRRSGGRNRFEAIVYRFNTYIVHPVRDFYVGLTATALKHRALFLLVGLVLLVISARQMPLVGRDLMPPMDTGIVKIAFETDANTSLEATDKTLSKMEEIIRSRPEVTSVSSVIGSEPAVVSFGSGRLAQQGVITVHMVDRFQRRESIWEIERDLRDRFRELPGLESVDVFDFGATALSSIRAPVDVMLTGPDLETLDRLGDEAEARLRAQLRDVTSISRSWRMDADEVNFTADPEKLALYRISPEQVAGQLSGSVRGMAASIYRVPNQDGIDIWIQLPREERRHLGQLETYPVETPLGQVPLIELGTISHQPVASVITRQNLARTLDIQAYREKRPISHLQEDVDAALEGLELPPGYSIHHEGEIKQMNESFGRLGQALGLGLVLLHFTLVPTFRSWLHPLTIMSAIPLALIGAAWSRLIFDKHGCMPSFMGMILLAGIVVKNSILMTAFSTVVGLIPIAGEWAIGLERLSPLAIVTIGGLIVSTFLTMVYVPILYSLLEDARLAVGLLFGRSQRQAA